MKDTEARESIERLGRDMRYAISEVRELRWDVAEAQAATPPRISVRCCKKCGHDTLQQRDLNFKGTYYLCLACGTKWQYRTEEVYTEIK